MDSKPPTPSGPSFYKRPLPPQCIAFDSEEGKRYFREAINEGNLETYFTLAQAFLTQDEPAYCGLATLCMALNALHVDPARQWKGPWRYYSQEMLDCCRPLSQVIIDGITLMEFACLARCNALTEETAYGPAVPLEDFESAMAQACSRSDQVFALAYSRKSLGQTGDGHFSPVAGYSKTSRKVLILDVARFKYPSYWISVEDAYNAMQPLDKATGLPRGYSILQRRGDCSQSPGTAVSQEAGLTTLAFDKLSWAKFVNDLRSVQSDNRETMVDAILLALDGLGHDGLLLRSQEHSHSTAMEDAEMAQQVKSASSSYAAAVQSLVGEVRQISVWPRIETCRVAASSDNHLQVMKRALFLEALLTLPSLPLKGWFTKPESPEERSALVASEISSVQRQMSSLQRCCDSERDCSCHASGDKKVSCCNVHK